MNMDPNRIRELIEAQHPDAAGWDAVDRGLDPNEARLIQEALLADPALGAELARVEAWDVELGHAFDNVEIPAGLADRLLAATQPPALLVPVTTAAVTSGVVAAVEPAPTSLARRPSRRALLRVMAGLAAAILITLGVANWSLTPEKLAVESLLDESLIASQESPESGWSSDWKSELLADYRFDSSALVVAPVRWRQQATTVDADAVIYDLAGPRRKSARLMVYRVPHVQVELSTFPARQPESTTGGYSLGAWQRGDLVYVLVVEGTAARYGTFVKELTTG